MSYDDDLLEELDDENEKKTAKEILNKKKVTNFELDMLFIDEDEENPEKEEE